MKINTLIKQCHRETREEQEAFLVTILSKAVADKFGHDTKPLLPILQELQTQVEELDKEPKDKNTVLQLELLDAILLCIAKEMLSREDFDFLDLCAMAEERLKAEVKREEECKNHAK